MRYRLSAVGCTYQPDLISYAYRVNPLLHTAPVKAPLSGLLLCFTQRPPYPTHGVRRSLVSPPNGICMSALAEPLCLQTRPAPWIIRELPPSLTAYHVTLFFHAGRCLPLSNVWSTVVSRGEEELGLLTCSSVFKTFTVTVALTHCTILVPKTKSHLQLPRCGSPNGARHV